MTIDESLIAPQRCLCCRRPLHIDNESGYCDRYPCRKARYASDQKYRENVLAWEKTKRRNDREYAEKRCAQFRASKRRAKLRETGNA